MSALTDRQRREEARAARYDTARTKCGHLEKVLAHWMEGLTAQASAERLELGERTVKRYRAFLELATGRGVDAGARKRGG